MPLDVFEFVTFEGQHVKKVKANFEEDKRLVSFHPGKCLLPSFYSEFEEKVLKTHVRESDVWLVSFPRTGSTWCQEMIWLITNNLDFETAKTTVQQVRAPLLELSMVFFEYVEDTNFTVDRVNKILSPKIHRGYLPLDLFPTRLENGNSHLKRIFTDTADFIDDLPSPRCIKSHLPIELLPEELTMVKPKIIYTMRNPKDLCVSYYYHLKMVHRLNVDFETFCELFLNDQVPFGSVFNHYIGFWNRRHEPNILIVRYEEMKNDIRGTVKIIAKFLEKSLTEKDIDDLCEFLSFQNMRENKACNLQPFVDSTKGDDYYKKSGTHFIRKGIIGDHKNHMSPEMIEKFDRWIEENTKGRDLTF